MRDVNSDILECCRNIDANALPWKVCGDVPIQLPPDPIIYMGVDHSTEYDVLVFEKEINYKMLPKLRSHGKICVLDARPQPENGIQLINERTLDGRLICVYRLSRKLKPIWNGIESGTILIYSNVGFGDDFFAARYPLLLKSPNHRFIFEARAEELSFFRHCSYYDDVCVKGDPLPPYDYCIEVTDLHDIRKPGIYFKPVGGVVRLPKTDKINVGVVIEGGYVKWGPNRSMSPDVFVDCPKSIQLYSFQKRNFLGKQAIIPNSVDLTLKLTNWLETARYLEQMDYLISVDTGIVHLAAGMGVNVHVLLNSDHHHFFIRPGERKSDKYEDNLTAHWGNYADSAREAFKDIIQARVPIYL